MRFWGIRDFDALKAIFTDKIPESDSINYNPDDTKSDKVDSKIIRVDFKNPLTKDKKKSKNT